MRLMTIKEFRDKATKVLRSEESLIITRRGAIAGIFLPYLSQEIPLEFKRELFARITKSIKRELDLKGLKEEEILEDFEEYRETRRGR